MAGPDLGELLGQHSLKRDEIRAIELKVPNATTNVDRDTLLSAIALKQEALAKLGSKIGTHYDEILQPAYSEQKSEIVSAREAVVKAEASVLLARNDLGKAEKKLFARWKEMQRASRAAGREIGPRPDRQIHVGFGQLSSYGRPSRAELEAAT